MSATLERPPLQATAPGGRRRVVLTLADQLVSSASNFALSALVARLGGVSALGAFGVALLVWFAVVGINRALVSEPMTVIGGVETRAREHGEGVTASVIVGLGAGALLAAVCGVLAEQGLAIAGVLALAPWLPSLLAQDYCRAAAFRTRRPHVALVSDLVFAVVQATATFALASVGDRNVAAFLGAWGIGATAGAVVGLAMLRARPVGLRRGWSRLARMWPRSRWFLAEFGTAFPGDQGYLFLLPLLLGTASFGLYRAASGLIGPIVVIFLAAGNVGLPEAVRSLREGGRAGLHRFTIRLTAVVAGVTVLYCGAVAVLAEPLLKLVYGTPFAAAATVTAFVAAQYVLNSLSFGAGVAMKAAGRMKALWVVRHLLRDAHDRQRRRVLATSAGLSARAWPQSSPGQPTRAGCSSPTSSRGPARPFAAEAGPTAWPRARPQARARPRSAGPGGGPRGRAPPPPSRWPERRRVTTAPAATTAPDPTVTPGRMVTFAPSQAPESITTCRPSTAACPPFRGPETVPRGDDRRAVADARHHHRA